MDPEPIDPDALASSSLTDDELRAAWIALDRVMAAQPDDRAEAGQVSTQASPRPAKGTASSILMAAMLGLADGMGFERPKQDTVEVADAATDDNSLKLDFKHLPPLDE